MKVNGSTVRAEHELLLWCARTCTDSERAEAIRGLVWGRINWDYLLQISLWHGMGPLLYRSLSTACQEAVPRAAMEQLQSHFYTNAYRNLLLTRELLILLNLFEANGIPSMPLRGPTLSESVYGDVSLRHFGDLDILIRRQDVAKVSELMMSRGYRLLHEPTAKLQAAYEKHHCHRAFVRHADGPDVEIHWLITPRYFSAPLDFERLWGRLSSTSFDGKDILVPSPEDSLLILCMHGSKHGWERLGWICDVAKLVTLHEDIRWRDVESDAGKLRSGRMLSLGLLLSHDLLRASLPKQVLQSARGDRVARALARQVRDRLFRNHGGGSIILKPFLFQLRIQAGVLDRILYCVRFIRAVMTPTVLERELISLPDSFFPLYYVVRPVRLIVKHGLRLASGLR